MNSKLKLAQQYIEENKHKVNNKYRHQYHMMSEIGWINDPNGFSFFDGKYHLFYQYNPFDSKWGPMHWGHVTSEDLVQWTYEPIALAPEEEYDYAGCFSGTAIKYKGNHVLMYTGVSEDKNEEQKKERKVRQEQCIAIGDGTKYKKIPENPVLTQQQVPAGFVNEDFRDPKILEKEGIYYCLVGTKTQDQRGAVLYYRSENLVDWEFVSVIDKDKYITGGTWECPDCFSIENKDFLFVAAQFIRPENLKYANLHSSIYKMGQMDYENGNFHEEYTNEIDCGFDFYAPQTLVDDKNRRIMVAWMQAWNRKMPSHDEGHYWAGAMTFPRELEIRDGKLIQNPVSDIEKYRKDKTQLSLSFEGNLSHPKCRGKIIELIIEFENIQANNFGVKLFKGEKEETVFNYCVNKEILTFDRRSSGIELTGESIDGGTLGIRQVKMELKSKKIKMRFLLDNTSVEAFINDGECALTGNIYSSSKSDGIEFYSDGMVEIQVTKYNLLFHNITQ